MPLVSLRQLLDHAAEYGYGLPAFNVNNMEQVWAIVDAAAELDAVDDVAPLVGPAHLQTAIQPPRQLEEVVGLQDHVVEFEEGQRLLAVEPRLDALEAQHPVDAEVPADVAQEVEVVEPV